MYCFKHTHTHTHPHIHCVTSYQGKCTFQSTFLHGELTQNSLLGMCYIHRALEPHHVLSHCTLEPQNSSLWDTYFLVCQPFATPPFFPRLWKPPSYFHVVGHHSILRLWVGSRVPGLSLIRMTSGCFHVVANGNLHVCVIHTTIMNKYQWCLYASF